MSDVTRILCQVGLGDPQAAEELLPLVYNELRKLADQKLRQEKPGQTLQATALVHEAYLRLVSPQATQPGNEGDTRAVSWNGRGHFFGAAAEAMRRILVERARRRASEKRGGDWERHDLDESALAAPETDGDLIALDEALDRLADADPQAAELVKLRFFAGMTIPQAAELLDVSPRTADFLWAYARAWLRREVNR